MDIVYSILNAAQRASFELWIADLGDVVRKVSDKVDPWASGLERYVAGDHMDTGDLRIRRWGLIGACAWRHLV